MKLWNRFLVCPHDEGDQGGTPPATTASQASAPAPHTAAAPNMTELADTLLKAIEGRTRRAETGVLKSMAEQYGMQESEMTAILDKAKAEKAKQLPDEARKQIEAATQQANDRLIAAEVKLLGSQMGLVDADVAARLLDRSGVKIGEGGAVTGVQEALDALKTAKGYLFGGAQQPTTGGFNPAGGSPATAAEAFEAQMRNAFGLKPETK